MKGKGSMDSCYDDSLKSGGYLDYKAMPCRYSYSINDLAHSDAVLFRMQALPPPELFPQHPGFQKWILFDNEAPPEAWKFHKNLSVYDNLFNLTAVWTNDADIQTRSMLKICSENPQKKKLLQHEDYAKKKRTDVLVAWFVSHCPTQSRREDYVAELRKYIDVDIYGACGDLECGKPTFSKELTEENDCDERMLHGNNSYKFYLSFENSLCPEYVTEKLYKIMDLDVVPVVMGAANYSSILPKSAYIDVKDYKRPKDLADYLLKLNQSDTLYNDYVYNKKILSCRTPINTDNIPLACKICKRLHELKNEVNIVRDIEKAYGPSRCMGLEEYLSLD